MALTENTKIKNGATLWARQTIESDIFHKPAEWFKIWFYIIQKVNHKDNHLFKRGENLFVYQRVSFDCSVTPSSVDHFVRWAKSAGQLATRKATRGIVISVLNYNKFQTLLNYKSGTESGTESDLSAGQGQNKSGTINKNDKTNKNDKKEPPYPLLEKKSESFQKAWSAYLDVRKKKRAPLTEHALSLISTLFNKYTESEQIEIINKSVMSGYQGLFDLKDKKKVVTF